MPSLDEIVREINRRALGRAFGNLQPRRKQIGNLHRMPSRVPFGKAADPTYAFHVGGRTELQFNLGIEEGLPGGDLRYGVAFSFEPSQTLPRFEDLLPKVARFNDFLREYGDTLSGLLMWHFDYGRRGETRHGPYPPRPITSDLFRPRVFVFLGKIGDSTAPDYERILEALEGLLPLWEFTEAITGSASDRATEPEPPLNRRRPSPLREAVATGTELTLNLELRHNEIQQRLFDALVAEYGEDCVGIEHEARGGGRIDVIVQTEAERILYEIKTAFTARGCIREALGQLLDYGCWPGRIPPTRLVIVGSPPDCEDVRQYLSRMSGLVPLRIEYRQVPLGDQSG